MKTLIIHPADESTTFLKVAYRNLHDRTVIIGGTTIDEVIELVHSHDRVMMCGHGDPWGLFSVGRFYDTFEYIVDETYVDLLKKKGNSIFIWCYANEFVNHYGLKGFYTGMFISETGEAEICGLSGITQEMVDESNFEFCRILADHIDQDTKTIYREVTREYGLHAGKNPVARYNHQRLFAGY